jgi:hypothetical protein
MAVIYISVLLLAAMGFSPDLGAFCKDDQVYPYCFFALFLHWILIFIFAAVLETKSYFADLVKMKYDAEVEDH